MENSELSKDIEKEDEEQCIIQGYLKIGWITKFNPWFLENRMDNSGLSKDTRKRMDNSGYPRIIENKMDDRGLGFFTMYLSPWPQTQIC